MYNAVDRLVERLFYGVKSTGETDALRQEVSANCRARYDDLLSQGKTQEEALAAVAESLVGMEEVISPYRTEAEEGGEAREKVFSIQEVKSLDAALKTFNLEIMEGDADTVTVRVEGPNAGRIGVKNEDGALSISEKDLPRNTERGKGFKSLLGDLFAIAEDAGRLMASFAAYDRVTVFLPESVGMDIRLAAASGDVSVGEIACRSLTAETTSGDVAVGETACRSLTIATMSGDVTAAARADEVRLSAGSGDIRWDGNALDLTLQTRSGDLTARGEAGRAALETASGDINAELSAEEMTLSAGSGDIDLTVDRADSRITVLTRAGDVEIDASRMARGSIDVDSGGGDVGILVDPDTETHCELRSRSGDVNAEIRETPSAALTVRAATGSGDINVRT